MKININPPFSSGHHMAMQNSRLSRNHKLLVLHDEGISHARGNSQNHLNTLLETPCPAVQGQRASVVSGRHRVVFKVIGSIRIWTRRP
jgi:hypothetical protein